MLSNLSEVNTNLQAYKLVNDPTCLLYLLFTKYGDIEEDYNLLYIDQLVYNKSSHYNNLFKERIIMNNNREFLRRIYVIRESSKRIPKLAEYYKNYYTYYCRPFFIDIYNSNLLHNYYNKKAKVFYKNNYTYTESDKIEINNKNINSTIISIDNDTQNKIIFNKRNRYLIDNDIDPTKFSFTFSLGNISKTNHSSELISKRSENDSFGKFLKYFISDCNTDKHKKINKNFSNYKNIFLTKNENENKNKNKKKNFDLINYLNNNKNNFDFIEEKKYNNKEKNDKFLLKDNSYNNLLDNIKKNFYNVSKKIKNKEKPIKITRNKSNFENFKISSINLTKDIHNNDKDIIIKNDNLNQSENKDLNESNIKNSNINFNEKLFFKINNKSNDKKLNEKNIFEIKSRNKKQSKDLDALCFKNFNELKTNKNYSNNFIDLLKGNKNINIFNNIKIKIIEMNKKIKSNDNNKKNLDKNLDSPKLNNNNKKSYKKNEFKKANEKLNIINKINIINPNNRNISNFKLINNNKRKFKRSPECLSRKANVLSRNKILFKRNSKTTDKLILLDSANIENNAINCSSIQKEKNKLFKSNSSYSKEKQKNFNFINYMKFSIIQRKKEDLNKNSPLNKNNNIKNIFNDLTKLKNNINISRNKNNNINFFNSYSIAHSLMQSLSQSRSINKENSNNKKLMRTSSFITKTIDNSKNNPINNLKIHKNKMTKERIEEIIKNSNKLLDKNLGINDKKNLKIKNKNIFKSFRKNPKKGFPIPKNIKQGFNINQNIFKNKQKK